MPEPKLTTLAPRGQAWEMTRYQAYQAQLAGRTIGETVTRAATFLKQAVADTPHSQTTDAHTAHRERWHQGSTAA